jgi:hypothetical protein
MTRWTLSILMLSPAVGCAWECPTYSAWDDLEVGIEDPEDAEQQSVQHRVALALDAFARWSGRDEVCVSSVEVVAPGDEQTLGWWTPDDASLVITTLGDDPWQSTTHELCHAVDWEEGISRAHRDLFTGEDVPHSLERPTRAHRRREDFALVCGNGPRDATRWRRWRDECGLRFDDEELAAIEMAQHEVFAPSQLIPWEQPSDALTIGEPWAPPTTPEGWRLVSYQAAGAELALLYALGDAGYGVDFVDPGSGRLFQRSTVAPCAHRLDCRVARLEGEGGPWLEVEAGDERWLLQLSMAGVERVENRCEGFDAQLVAGAALWTWDGEDLPTVTGCDLATGALVEPPISTPAFPMEDHWVTQAWPRLGRVGGRPAVHWSDLGLTWLAQDTGSWHEQILPYHLAVKQVVPLPDGRVLLLVETVDSAHTWQLTVAWFDPATGEFEAPDNACPLPARKDRAFNRWAVAGDGWAVLWEGWDLADEETLFLPLSWG